MTEKQIWFMTPHFKAGIEKRIEGPSAVLSQYLLEAEIMKLR